MTTNAEGLLETVRTTLSVNKNLSREEIEHRTIGFKDVLRIDISDEEIELIIRKLQEEMQWTMDIGTTLTDNSAHNPWLADHRKNIDWFFWNRYKRQLSINGFGHNIIGKMDIVTDELLDLLKNPKDEGPWQRKGLVVGHVQSGKTANYSALVCKALDAGYKVVIILAGLLNTLRRQTQSRIDTGVIGLDSSLALADVPSQSRLIGVGRIDGRIQPVTLTTTQADFQRVIATRLQAGIHQFNVPVVFVIKKNVSILNNLKEWLEGNNFNLSQIPMLLIDDEADHASINTRREDLDPTKTNQSIRELLELFPKNIYLGYTATPFANIFINPDTTEDMMNDLFPENFIKTLDPPSNYFGSDKIFVSNKANAVREIDDYGDFLPLKHKITDEPEFLPNSLTHAIRVHVLSCTIRILRGQENEHNSMLVNVSRFTSIQSKVRVMIHNYVADLRTAIENYASLDTYEALQNEQISSIYDSWKVDFESLEFEWDSIQSKIKTAISKIDVIEVNSSPNAERDIDFSERNYPHGRSIIAIGGLSLSRGITLEGLSTSYFLRNSMMYDTLMQMGRWFGYRNGYEDVCRIFMPRTARGWYRHIAHATNELRSEFVKMGQLNKTPRDFGLAVRNHPESLIVTARNKMRSARTIVREIDLTGRLIETSRLFTIDKKIQSNLNLANNFVKYLRGNCKTKIIKGKHFFWEDVGYEKIREFVELYENHPESSLTDSFSVKNYVNDLAVDEGIEEWRVILVNPDSKSNLQCSFDELKNISLSFRQKNIDKIQAGIMLSQRKLIPDNYEKMDLKKDEIREIPLLMVNLLDCRYEGDEETPIFPNGAVGYAISFPGEKNGRRIKKLATYQVNTVWMQKQYGDEIEDDQDVGGDI